MSTQDVITIMIAIFGSTGLWTVINTLLQNRKSRKSVERDALLGLLHERLYSQCMEFIERKYITDDELEDLEKYLWLPYHELGGNGTGEALFKQVQKLEIRD